MERTEDSKINHGLRNCWNFISVFGDADFGKMGDGTEQQTDRTLRLQCWIVTQQVNKVEAGNC